MSARKTGLTIAAYTLDGNAHLGDLRMFSMDLVGTEAERQGIAATSAYTQVVKRSATHSFELVRDNAGPAYTNLDVSVWTPDGSARLGDLKSGSLSLAVPVQDGSGLADAFEFAHVVGARRISVEAEMLIPAAAATEQVLDDARSANVADWTMATVLLSLGGASFNLPMTLTAASHKADIDGFQVVSASYALRGTPAATPTGGSLLGVAFAGDALVSLVADMGFKTWSGTGVVESLSLEFADGALQKLSGTLKMQGQPGWA